MSRIVIIGGGLSGLTAAYWLATAGFETIVLEASNNFGGNTKTARLGPFLSELGEAHFDDTPKTLRNLCAELGLEVQTSPDHRTVVRLNGQDWVLPPQLNLTSGFGLSQLAELPFGPGVRWRLKTERFVASTSVKDEPLSAFFRRRLGPEIWRVLEPYLSTMLGGAAEDVSAPVAFGRLVELERHGGLLAGSRRLTSSGKLGLAGGMGSLVEALSKQLLHKARLLPNHEVWALTRDSSGWQIYLRGNKLEAQAVIVALPAPKAAKVFRPTAPQLTTLLNHFPHQHGAKVFLLYRHVELSVQPGVYFFAQGEGFTCSAIKVYRQSDLSCIPPNAEALSPLAPQPLTLPNDGSALLELHFIGEVARSADSELTRLAQQNAAQYLQTKAHPLAAWVFRQPHSRPQFTPGHGRRVTELDRELVHAPGLFLTGSYLAGPGLANLVEHSRLTAHLALDYLLQSAAN